MQAKMELALLNTKPLYDGVIAFLFAENKNIVLSDKSGLLTIFGCQTKTIGSKKRPYTESEIEYLTKYDPKGIDEKLWVVYEVDWKSFQGEPIEGTNLLQGSSISRGSSGISSSATLYRFAVDPINNLVVSCMETSYSGSSQIQIQNWEQSVFQKHSNLATLD
jgi:hypothetical protein